ncbi:MAG: TraR/DksA family transcriptional regulator [Deltaproteobacteria bacterium]|nr:TraR/DksA family transcriptional regulator [Deltaproteobacteria bacterium]
MTLSEETKQNCRAMLLEMRRDLLSEAKANRQSNSGRDYLGDLCDWAVSEMEAEYVYMIGERLRQKLFLIEEALDAIENGDYGICAECGEPIDEKRLLLMPSTLLCVRCQSELERQARMRGQLAA